MDHLCRIAQAVAYIEANLDEPIVLEQVACEAGYSLFHFHRLFHAVVGDSVKEYIRKRRLTRSAEELIRTERRVVDIAMDYCYESHESFTRAFKKMYGVAPVQYRKRDRWEPLLEPARIAGVQAPPVQGGFCMEPRFVDLPEFTVVGTKYFGNNLRGEIGQMWTKFIPRIPGIPFKTGPQMSWYGVCFDANENGEFAYVSGVAVSRADQIPEGMVAKTVPAGRYAVFTHRGKLDTLRDTYQQIYGTWVPRAGLSVRGGFDFEYYDERFKDGCDDSEVDIYIPIN